MTAQERKEIREQARYDAMIANAKRKVEGDVERQMRANLNRAFGIGQR